MASLRCESQAERTVPAPLTPRFSGLAESGRPILVLSLPTEHILLTTPAAHQLLAPAESDLTGRQLSEFTSPADPEAGDLLVKGHLNCYQSRRTLRRDPSIELSLWFRASADDDRTAPALAMLSNPADGTDWSLTGDGPVTPFVIGTVDRQLAIDRVSEDVEQSLGYRPDELFGRSILSLISPDDLAALLFSLGRATATQDGVGLAIKFVRADHIRVRCQLVLLPLTAVPSFAFAIQPAGGFVGDRRPVTDLLRRFGQGIAAAAAAKDLTSYRPGLRPALPELTGREMQIVSRLLAGDRVPAISQQLYLAQSTVRNHLSAVFAKLGVKSQQELIVLLRRAQGRP